MNSGKAFHKLWQYLHSPATHGADVVLGGSATPGLSLKELIELSSDPDTTRQAFNLQDIAFNLGSDAGDDKLRQTVASLYDSGLSQVTSSSVVIANGTTGSNHIVHQSLLQPGDHIICQYPIYGPCIEEPQIIGCDVSYLRLDPQNNWELDVKQLERLIIPGKTKFLMLNSPVNPTGTHFTTSLQREIITLCKKHDIIVHCDEIFRPLFHTDDIPTSMIEHNDLDYDNVLVTSSLSKSYGMSGIRIGWIVTRSQNLYKKFMDYRVMSCSSVSVVDEAIAREALSVRCRPGILRKHAELAKTNISLIQAFVDKHPDVCEWTRPTAGAIGFLKIKDPATGNPVDDVEFCKRLASEKGVIVSPGTECFEFGDSKEACAGRFRIHFTTLTKDVQKGLQLLEEFLTTWKSTN